MSAILVRVIFLPLLLFVVIGCKNEPPSISGISWTSVEVDYWFLNETRERERRTLRLKDEQLIRSGFALLEPNEQSYNYFKGDSQIRLVDSLGRKWTCGVVFENRFDFNPPAKVGKPFHLEPMKLEFFNWLRQLCRDDLRRDFPKADDEHVILRSNLSDERRPCMFENQE